MREVSITVDVMCNWDIEPPQYRLYVDDDLLTERTYIWRNNEQYVRERIIVNLSPGIHSLRVETSNKGCKFYCMNFKIDNNRAYFVDNRFTVH